MKCLEGREFVCILELRVRSSCQFRFTYVGIDRYAELNKEYCTAERFGSIETLRANW